MTGNIKDWDKPFLYYLLFIVLLRSVEPPTSTLFLFFSFRFKNKIKKFPFYFFKRKNVFLCVPERASERERNKVEKQSVQRPAKKTTVNEKSRAF